MYTFRTSLLFVEDKNAAQDMAEYATQLLEDVLEETIRKPHGTALALEPTHATSVSKAIATLDGEGAQQGMGQWVRKAMSLVPVQISRCGGTVLLGLSFSAVKVYVPQNQWYDHVPFSSCISHRAAREANRGPSSACDITQYAAQLAQPMSQGSICRQHLGANT